MHGGVSTAPLGLPPSRSALRETLSRVGTYTLRRVVVLLATVVIGTYLAVLIANWGGEVDRMREAQCKEKAGISLQADPLLQLLPPQERQRRYEQEVERCKTLQGLDRPFLQRSLEYLVDALTLSLGRAIQLTSDSGSREVRNILLERLPATLLLFGTADLVLFFMAISLALFLSRQYGSFLDRVIVGLAPTSTAPGWFYGIFLILIFAGLLHLLPFGGMVDTPPPTDTATYATSVLRHLILPVAAIVIGSICLSIYSWRTFFLIYSSEDYVEMAKAKGLTSGMIQRRYILRPTLPPIITGFSFMLISLWQGAIILETVFNWPGLGRLLYSAIGSQDTPVIIGTVVIYGYLLALTVFVLDIVYALIDPRVKVGERGVGT
jgi:peptide/nickel transport system permease protein